MPNWCENTLKVTGNPEQLKDFVSKVITIHEDGREELTMNNLYPTPPELLEVGAPASYTGDPKDEEAKAEFKKQLEELVTKYGHTDWYNWRVHNWGTKWDIGECFITENSDEEVVISFDSAWSPPLTFFRYASEQYPELDFSILFSEPGQEYCGLYKVGRGGQDESVAEGEYEYINEENNEVVEFDSELQKWKYSKSGEVIETENFWPIGVNPYDEDF